jgi:hypothetical protein
VNLEVGFLMHVSPFTKFQMRFYGRYAAGTRSGISRRCTPSDPQVAMAMPIHASIRSVRAVPVHLGILGFDLDVVEKATKLLSFTPL